MDCDGDTSEVINGGGLEEDRRSNVGRGTEGMQDFCFCCMDKEYRHEDLPKGGIRFAVNKSVCKVSMEWAHLHSSGEKKGEEVSDKHEMNVS